MASSDKDRSTMKNVAMAGVAAAAASIGQRANAQGSGKIKVGLLGCGGRGNGAMRHSLQADPGVEIVALADLFENKVRGTRDRIMRDERDRRSGRPVREQGQRHARSHHERREVHRSHQGR